MTKLWIIGVFCVIALMQLTQARDLAEALDNDIREYLKGYQKFLNEDDGTHKEDLTKLIEITETALKADGVDAKQAILKSLNDNFKPEFNKYIAEKLEEFQVNDDIQNSIEFYQSLLKTKTEFKDEIEKTIATLHDLLKEADLKKKEEGFLNFNKEFTPEFMKFLNENALPTVNRDLQKTAEFFENLLIEKDTKYATEIQELKTKAEAALGDVSIEEKQAALYQVTNPKDHELYEYLQKKFIELN